MSTQPNQPGSEGLPKTYRPADHESRVTARWDEARAFHADPSRVLRGEAEPYCVFIPPPNVTAALHLGHALNNTLQDVLVRAHRMMGYETLWMPGTDHAGIATQAVVEKRVLKEEGKRRKDFTREEFVAKIQAFKDEYEATITAQLKEMGCSCDWDRQRFTMDDQCAAAVREAFFQLFKDGLIYRGKRLVNWDPALQTAVADDECYEEEIDAAFYYLRYPLVRHEPGAGKGEGKDSHAADTWHPVTWNELAARGYPGASEHPGEHQAWVTVATTRPETYLGDSAIGMNPRDPRFKALGGLRVELPLVGRVLPIVADDYVVLPAAMWEDPEAAKNDPKAQYASGFLKVTPAHDQNDYDLYLRHKAAIDSNSAGNGLINVMAPDGSISDKHGWNDIGDAHLFVGLSREDARKKVVAEFKARGLLESTRPYRHSVKHSDRSKAIVEPYLSDQWYVKVTDPRMAQAANEALVGRQSSKPAKLQSSNPHDSSLTFHPDRYAKTYEQWHDNIRDWCISRQLWWGHRIPVWRLDATRSGSSLDVQEVYRAVMESLWYVGAASTHVFPMAERCYYLVSRSPADDAKLARLGRLISRIDQPHSANESGAIENFDLIKCSVFEQDPDVLDTWFSSALWPLSTLGWPNPEAFNAAANKGLLDAFNPSSVLCTAREIITLWVSRMVMMNRYFREGAGQQASGTSADPAARGKGPVPFKDVFIHAMIQDGEGRKMSKSLGNGVDPRDIIASHGSDAMRFTLVQMTTQTQDVRMPVERDPATGTNTSPKFDLGRNYCNKLWNTTRFVMEKLGGGGGGRHEGTEARSHAGKVDAAGLSLLDRWMLSRLAKSVQSINASIKNYEFSDYAETMYRLLWWDLCDWYLEGVKPTVEKSTAQQAVLAHALQTIVRLLHPIAPFITETIYEHLRHVQTASIDGFELAAPRKGDLLCTAGWPRIDEKWADDSVEARFEQVRELINGVRNLRSEHQVPPKRRITLHVPASALKTHAIISECGSLVETLCGLEKIEHGAPAGAASAGGGNAVSLRVLGEELFVSNLADAVDAGAERERLTKQIADLEKTESTMEKRLGNEGYIAKAPPKLVEESKAQLAKVKAEIQALREKLRSLS